MRKSTKTKFNVDKSTKNRTYNGVVYDSRTEMMFYRDWILPKMKTGEIVECQSQVPFELQPAFDHITDDGKKVKVRKVDYVADYVLTYADGKQEVIDIKGFADSVALLKRKLFWYRYPELNYKWISYSKCDGGWIEYDSLKKARKARKANKSNKGE